VLQRGEKFMTDRMEKKETSSILAEEFMLLPESDKSYIEGYMVRAEEVRNLRNKIRELNETARPQIGV
jgi:hypothetical protein